LYERLEEVGPPILSGSNPLIEEDQKQEIGYSVQPKKGPNFPFF
jgi:hypothetical protein